MSLLRQRVVVDTGPLVAFVNRRDTQHQAATELFWVRILCNDAVTTIFQWVGSAPLYDQWDSSWHLRSQPAHARIMGGPGRLAIDCLRARACSSLGTRALGAPGQGTRGQGTPSE